MQEDTMTLVLPILNLIRAKVHGCHHDDLTEVLVTCCNRDDFNRSLSYLIQCKKIEPQANGYQLA